MNDITKCRIRQGPFRGWEACYLENEYIQLVAVPDIGGRVMAYDLGPHPFLFVDPNLAGKLFTPEENMGDGSLAAWKNYGGDKTWPAPQGWESDEQWHGPPDPILDTGRYSLEKLAASSSSAMVRMVSPPDMRTGLQIKRQFKLFPGSSRVQVDLTFLCLAEQPVRWSIWDVVQLRAERRQADGSLGHDPTCSVTTPLNPNSRFPRGYNVMFGDEDNPQWGTDESGKLFKAQYLWEIGKVGIDSPAGWIAFSQPTEGYAFTERFQYEPGADYPDDGVTVECWTVGSGQVANLDYAATHIYLMETEVLGPLRTIQPGQSTTFSIEWGVCRCFGTVVDVGEAGCVTEPLMAQPSGDYARLSGQFGVFDYGEMFLAWCAEDGQVITRHSLGWVDPLAAFNLDKVVFLPGDARTVELWLTAAADGQERRLATTRLV